MSVFLYVDAFGAVGDGLNDDTYALQSAIDEADRLGGAIVCFAGGKTYRCTGQLYLDDRRGVHLLGVAGPNGSPASAINYTGVCAPFISLRSCFSISFRNLQITYSSACFVGDFIKSGWSTRQADPGYCLFEGCWFSGVGEAQGGPAASLMNLSKLIVSSVRDCAFGNAKVAIHGAAESYSNGIQVQACVFMGQGEAAIKNAGEAWLVSGCAFEPLASGRAGAYRQTNTYSLGLTFIGCWMGDVSQPGGAWIDTTGPQGGVAVLGLAIINNRMAAAGTDAADACVRLGGGQGVAIIGNRMEGPVCVEFAQGYTLGVFIGGNDLQSPVPLKGLGNAREYLIAGNNNLGGQGVFASFRLEPGNAPTAPQDGDLWTTPAGLFIQLNGVTKQVTLT